MKMGFEEYNKNIFTYLNDWNLLSFVGPLQSNQNINICTTCRGKHKKLTLIYSNPNHLE